MKPALIFLCLSSYLIPAAHAFEALKEPSIQEVQAEAVRRLGFHESELEAWGRRARWSAALPQLQAGFQRDLKDVVRLTTRDSVSIRDGEVFIGPDENDFDQNFDQGTRFEVKAVWSLNELVFNRDSLSVSSERRDWVREKNRVLQDVSDAYFVRKRLIEELRSRSDPLPIRDRKKLLLDQATGTLDAYTGGWFSNQIQKGDRL
ncbi:MAG TPA: hypothetical protein VLJ37_07510 [bacterium]|nr:hypothetical protein [bacterium]